MPVSPSGLLVAPHAVSQGITSSSGISRGMVRRLLYGFAGFDVVERVVALALRTGAAFEQQDEPPEGGPCGGGEVRPELGDEAREDGGHFAQPRLRARL